MVKFYRANDGVHKYVAEFTDPPKKVKFGAIGYDDFTTTGDEVRKALYLNRHRATENWSNPKTPGALSRWILWGDSKSLRKNIESFKRRFGMS